MPDSEVSEESAIATSEEVTTTEPESTESATAPVTNVSASENPAPEPAAVPQSNFFNEGVTRAQSAVAIGQSAQSTDDWNLAASRWQQAAVYMQQVPAADPNYATAQQKIQEYQQNQVLAERRAAGKGPATTQVAEAERPAGLIASIPIVNRLPGGSPVVPVTLTGNQSSRQFTMMFDTGASATLITQAMANEIGVVSLGTATFVVADGRQVQVPIGYVDTLEVGDLVVTDLVVGIGGDVGLLGQDVYGEYGLSIGASRIDLYQ
ncbi:retropepsin-like aspartic protease [Oscillatoria sp. CS-180]|uniref:retropepsin-like aspartic protease family protein n=1 Tax=Oscillatoria sp. CS-180 TaxID=3021720 RepID=UPI00232EF585|nr:retropepsin-like aspartic protease [Oscillatoria sp. CS-180]MDB9526184.1 retropepsin-like aspartic protease [Oscillatoria sp. CS-180]